MSCPWQLPGTEDIDSGKYRIERDRHMKKFICPQDVVLDRVTKFADAKGLPFWIDKLCIDQLDSSDEKEWTTPFQQHTGRGSGGGRENGKLSREE